MADTMQTAFSNAFNDNHILVPISLSFVPRGQIDNKSALMLVVAWHRTGNTPLPALIMTQFCDAIGRNELKEIDNLNQNSTVVIQERNLKLLSAKWPPFWSGFTNVNRNWKNSNDDNQLHIISMGLCKKDVTPVREQWSYIFLALTHWLDNHEKMIVSPYLRSDWNYKGSNF